MDRILLPLRYSINAVQNRDSLLNFIAAQHSTHIANSVATKFQTVLDSIKQFPYSYPIEETKRLGPVHKATIDGLTLIFYRVTLTHIDILDVVDARSDWK